MQLEKAKQIWGWESKDWKEKFRTWYSKCFEVVWSEDGRLELEFQQGRLRLESKYRQYDFGEVDAVTNVVLSLSPAYG